MPDAAVAVEGLRAGKRRDLLAGARAEFGHFGGQGGGEDRVEIRDALQARVAGPEASVAYRVVAWSRAWMRRETSKRKASFPASCADARWGCCCSVKCVIADWRRLRRCRSYTAARARARPGPHVGPEAGQPARVDPVRLGQIAEDARQVACLARIARDRWQTS